MPSGRRGALCARAPARDPPRQARHRVEERCFSGPVNAARAVGREHFRRGRVRADPLRARRSGRAVSDSPLFTHLSRVRGRSTFFLLAVSAMVSGSTVVQAHCVGPLVAAVELRERVDGEAAPNEKKNNVRARAPAETALMVARCALASLPIQHLCVRADRDVAAAAPPRKTRIGKKGRCEISSGSCCEQLLRRGSQSRHACKHCAGPPAGGACRKPRAGASSVRRPTAGQGTCVVPTLQLSVCSRGTQTARACVKARRAPLY